MAEIIFRSLGDLTHSRIIGIVIRSLIVTLLIFVALGIALGWLLIGSDPCTLLGEYECVLDASAGGIGAFALTLLAIWFLFPAVAIGVICTYIDQIAGIIETLHYPQARQDARPLGVAGGALLGLRSAARVMIYNLLALPFYIVLLLTGIGPIILFVIVNGIAFGRDLGEMVAARHGDRTSRRDWLRGSRGGRMIIGSAVTGLFLVPFLNLLAPVLGAAMATHLYHRTRPLGIAQPA
jgi:CysZ protein